jgi:transcription elongation factor GreA
MNVTYLTKEGLQELQEKLNDLKNVRRREIAEAIHTAKEQGDLSENAEYVNAKEEQQRVEMTISELENTLKHAQLIQETGTNEVSIGNEVTLKFNGTTKTYRIVGSKETDPLAQKVSNESPLGKSLLGGKKGDKVIIPTPGGDKECVIVKIN